jgi:hypothetical protein
MISLRLNAADGNSPYGGLACSGCTGAGDSAFGVVVLDEDLVGHTAVTGLSNQPACGSNSH